MAEPQESATGAGVQIDSIRDLEGEPLTGAHTGQDRTRIPEHTHMRGHGPKTRQRSKDIINRKG